MLCGVSKSVYVWRAAVVAHCAGPHVKQTTVEATTRVAISFILRRINDVFVGIPLCCYTLKGKRKILLFITRLACTMLYII